MLNRPSRSALTACRARNSSFSCAQQLSDAARVLLSGFLTVTGPEGARRVPIDPGVANAVLADRLRDYDGAEMEVRVMAAQTYMPKEIEP